MENTVITKNKRHSAFRLFIREEFLRRCKNNSSYSLRSFARQIGVDASLLSKVMRGQRPPSDEMMKAVGPTIGLRPQQLSQLLNGKNVNYNRVSEDVFAVIGDWFHFAILELTKTEGFESNPAWIAKRLSIHKTEVEAALERLERLDFIELKNSQYVMKTENNSWASQEKPSAARKSLQRQLVVKAVEAIDNVPFELRESGSLTIACSTALLPGLKKKIQSFKKEIDEFVEAHEKPNEVYQLVVALYPLTKIKENSGEKA